MDKCRKLTPLAVSGLMLWTNHKKWKRLSLCKRLHVNTVTENLTFLHKHLCQFPQFICRLLRHLWLSKLCPQKCTVYTSIVKFKGQNCMSMVVSSLKKDACSFVSLLSPYNILYPALKHKREVADEDCRYFEWRRP